MVDAPMVLLGVLYFAVVLIVPLLGYVLYKIKA